MVHGRDKGLSGVRRGAAALALATLAACATPPVRVAFDAGVDFSAQRTFAVTGGEGIEGVPDARMVRAISGALAARGLEEAPEGAADLWARWRGEMHRHTVLREYVSAPMLGRRNLEPTVVREGRLTVALQDPATGRALWEGTMEGVVDDPDRAHATVERAVARILAAFPPGTGPMTVETR